MSAWRGLREERDAGGRLARRIAGLFGQVMGKRVVRDERFQRRVVRHAQSVVMTWRTGLALSPTAERVLGGAGWRVWSTPARLSGSAGWGERSDTHQAVRSARSPAAMAAG